MSSRYFEAAAENILATMRAAGRGSRNDTLNECAFRLGRVLHLANGSTDGAVAELISAAVATGLTYKEARRTVSRSIKDGAKQPRELTEMPRAPDWWTILAPLVDRGVIDKEEDHDEGRLEAARKIWADALPVRGTVAQTYLNNRGLPTLNAERARYHADPLGGGEAIVFPVTEIMDDGMPGDLMAVQCVFLDSTGHKRKHATMNAEKLTRGYLTGHAFLQVAGMHAPWVIVEGPEDAVSVAWAVKQIGGEINVAASFGKSNLGNIKLPTDQKILHLADPDAEDIPGTITMRLAGVLGCKDANEAIQKKGAETLAKAVLAGFEGERVRQPGEIVPTPFVMRDGRQIAPRQWVYGKHLIRKFVSATISPGGIGKSSLVIVEALSIATGRQLLDVAVSAPARVWLWNGEDPRDELDRRIIAACKHYKIAQADIADRLLVDSGREQELIVATRVSGEAVVQVPVVDGLIAAIRDRQIDVMVVDPFVSSHRVSENANEEIDRVVKAWNRVADATNCAIELVHHSRKTNGAEVSVEDSRGASSLLAAARSARALNSMTQADADTFGIAEDRWRYFRADDGKANLAPRSDKATWFRLETISLDNGTLEHPADLVGVVTQWKPPGLFEGVTIVSIKQCLDLIEHGPMDDKGDPSGGRFMFGRQSNDWCGHVVAKHFGVEETRAAKMVDAWTKSGLLFKVEFNCPARRKKREGVAVNYDLLPGVENGCAS